MATIVSGRVNTSFLVQGSKSEYDLRETLTCGSTNPSKQGRLFLVGVALKRAPLDSHIFGDF